MHAGGSDGEAPTAAAHSDAGRRQRVLTDLHLNVESAGPDSQEPHASNFTQGPSGASLIDDCLERGFQEQFHAGPGGGLKLKAFNAMTDGPKKVGAS